METQGPEYLEHLKNKYHLGRSLYLTTLVYPRYLKEISFGDVWDFGCGLGEFLSYCKKRSRPAYGLDSNPYFVQACRARGLTVWLDDITDPQTLKGKIKNIICDNVLEHLSPAEINSFLRNAKTRMLPGGVLLVIVPGWKGYLRDPTHKTFITQEVMKSLCEETNLAIEKVFYHPFQARAVGKYFYLNMSVFKMIV